MLCMTTDDLFAAYERTHAPIEKAKVGPKIAGSSWAARKEAALFREVEAKKREARLG